MMCGIVGFSWEDKTLLESCVESIQHRGPDDQGFHVDNHVSLGHVRLSILDLTSAGHQPLTDGKRFITFNGEIYNFMELREELEKKGHSFTTRTDTEVILKAYDEWGPDAVQRFNGMWAFCIYDPDKQEFFLSRDRFGQKPLYYAFLKKELMFASEIKALLQVRKFPLNEPLVSDYLYFDMMDHTDETFFKGVKKLPASHNAVFDLKRKTLKIERYYTLKHSDSGLLPIFSDACLLRMVSDVPVSLSLSGGVDSSSIGAVYASKGIKLKAFTTTSESGIGDETENISYLMGKYKDAFDLQKIPIDMPDVIDSFEKCIYHLESPIVGSVLPRLAIAKAVSEQKYKVLICGEGADEMLGGYASAYPFIIASLFRKGKISTALKTWFEGRKYITPRAFFFLAYYLAPKWKKRVLIRMFSSFARKKYGLKLDASSAQRLRNSHFSYPEEYFEYGLWRGGIPLLLGYNDKIPMAFGLELRAPFMDYRVVERIMSIPAQQRVGKGYTKYYFRLLMQSLVPKEILWDKRKIGFQSPTAEYLRSESCQSFVKKAFSKPACSVYIDAKRFLSLYEKFIATGKGDTTMLLKIISLELFLKVFFD